MRHIKKYLFLFLVTTTANAVDFIEITLDPGERREFDSITMLINRSIVGYVEISENKTPERAWYRLNLYSVNTIIGTQDKEQRNKLLSLECDNSKIVESIKNAVTVGTSKEINAKEVCKLIVQ